MIILLGGSGYVGAAFRELLSRKQVDHRSISRRDYTTVEPLAELIRDTKASFLINAAGYTGKPNVNTYDRGKAACGCCHLPGSRSF